jgi:hypothetical protein
VTPGPTLSLEEFARRGLAATAAAAPRVLLNIPIRITNPLNGAMGDSRLRLIMRSQQRAKHRRTVYVLTQAAIHSAGFSRASLVPAVVHLTRIGAGTLDGDGLQAAFKAVRDGVADALGVSDGGPFVRWEYDQRKGPRKFYAVEVLIVRVP